MSDRTSITRRSAIRTGTLSALGVGLMTAAGAPPTVAEAAPRVDLIAALFAEPTPDADARFSEWVDEWHAERATVSAEHRAILDELKAYVPVDRQYELVGKLSDLFGDRGMLEMSSAKEKSPSDAIESPQTMA